MTDFTVNKEDKYYEYHGEVWRILQNGENILFAKKETLMDSGEGTYVLLYDPNNKGFKDRYSDISDVDRIFIKK